MNYVVMKGSTSQGGNMLSEKEIRQINGDANRLNHSLSPEMHEKLNKILADEEVANFFYAKLYTTALQLLFNTTKISEDRNTPLKMQDVLEPLGIKYFQYKALLQGKGKASTLNQLIHALALQGIEYSKLLHSEALIEMADDYMTHILGK
ncbi:MULTISPECIES: hypothetical protein [Arcicella]|uniref:CRISPR type III-B/RAMP module-associated protein Cmr5 n=1 Tax=Arcicella aquatica TaxID=217141 RepID=A0ABU5QLK1_9BACT|nr:MULTISPECIES: hypothetical protein [Arcicella]MDR6562447.1 16S rRNA C967 or C1407 C5-methylase (RsmB/RsmF family) [Arcicella sp. BE51]MDR6812341.1 16S rRNA C967 or C1407 C5-methylase (RsmB/RsmF family) [Arcicella sp. BE140]MDR6823511.1 16S rRNA C967 or C1407 C5-methylase (RsmB/RsmF family) [Arcicella sp. BE139]MEA5257913.1 hypothetical protein [Arcicella aquatica]